MNKILLFLFIIIIISCNSSKEKYFDAIKGEWQIVKFDRKEDNHKWKKYLIIGFDKSSSFWLSDLDGNFLTYQYELSKQSDSLSMNIINKSESKLNGNYDLHIDTIQNNPEDYIIQITLDSENTYIQAIRSKLKYYSHDEFVKKSQE